MKTDIYVFTGTGTSLAVAKKIGDFLEDVEINSIAKLMDQTSLATTSKNIGFIFPCYYGTIPNIVKAFINRLDVSRTDYFFAITTAGGSKGYALEAVNKILKTKNKQLNYGKSIIVASNYMVASYYDYIIPKEEMVQKNIEAVESITQSIANDLQHKQTSIEKKERLGYILPQLISPSSLVKNTEPWDREFDAGDKCIGCSVCKRVCPVHNIEMVNNKPTFNQKCQRCMACIQFCPKQALEVNGKKMNKRKFTFPDISVEALEAFNSLSD